MVKEILFITFFNFVDDGTDWPISEIDSNQQNILPNGNANELMAPNEGTMTEVNYKLAKLIGDYYFYFFYYINSPTVFVFNF